jgi:FSR family fosmidomycin resistance protein-like MFS transporter
MNLTIHNFRSDSKTRLLSTLTVGHGTNDFYIVLLPVLLPLIAADFGLNYTQFGFVFLVTTILSGFLQPVVGFVADRYGVQKRIIILGFFMFAFGLAGFSVAATFLALIVASFIYGFGETTFHAQSTNYITMAFAEKKGRAMGVHGIGGSLGNFAAPITAALLIAAFGWRRAALMLAIPAVILIIGLTVSLKPGKKNDHITFGKGLSWGLVLLGINFGLVTMLYRGFLAFLPTWLLENNVPLVSAGAITSLMLAIGVIAQPFGGVIYDRFGGKVVFLASPIIAGLAILLMTWLEGWVVVLLIVIVGASITMLFPVALTMASSFGGAAAAGMSVGLVFGISTTMSSFTPLLTGLLADQFGLDSAFRLLIALPLLATIMTLFRSSQNRQKTG